MIPEYLDSGTECLYNLCKNPDCPKAVKLRAETGRWYITMGHVGFNSRANNGNGYASQHAAYKAMRSYFAKK